MTRALAARSLTRALVATALLVLVTACGGADDSPDAASKGSGERESLTVVLDWSPNTNHNGLYLARAKGWYEDAGLDVRIIEPGDVGSVQILGSGKADVGFTVQEDLVPARAEGVPVVGIGAVIEHNTSSLVSLASDGVTRPRGLDGKTYGGFGGILEQALVKTLVECDGGDPAKVKFADVGEADYRVGLERNQYDSVWIFDGWDGIRFKDIDGLDVDSIPFVDYERCIPDWYTPILAASQSMIDKHPEALTRFMDVTARGYREAMKDPKGAARDLLDEVPELDREFVEKSSIYLSTRYAADPDEWGRIDTKRWTSFVDFLVDAKIIDKPIIVKDSFTNRFLPDRGHR